VSLVEINVVVNDDTAAGFASVLARAQALKQAMGDIKIGVEVQDTALPALITAMEALNAASGKTKDSTGAAAASLGFFGAVAGRAAGWFGGMANKVDLFGGVLNGILPTWLAGASYLHILADGVLEFVSVLGPAIIALVAFGAAATPTIQAIKNQMTNLQTVVEATGHSIYPLTGAFTKAADAAKPYVYQLFGDALVIAGNKSGIFAQIVGDTGMALATLGGRFQLAVDNAGGFGGIMRNAAHDVLTLGNIVGNLGGILGAVFRAVPGYAQVFLNLAQSITGVAEHIAIAGEPLLHFGLLAHGAFLYAGLGATALTKMLPPLLLGIGNFAANLGRVEGPLARMGGLGAAAASGMRGFGVAAAGASALPWGWIALAAAGFGALAYAALSAKTATQQWFASAQQAIGAMDATKGYAALMDLQAQAASRLAGVQQQLGSAYKNLSNPIVSTQASMGKGNATMIEAYQRGQQLQQGMSQGAQEAASYNAKIRALSDQYHGMGIAQGLVTASGVSMQSMMTKGAGAMANVRAQVAATAHAYAAMGQTGGVLGTDMAVLNRLTSDQYTQMQKLDQAMATFVGRGTGVETGLTGVIGQMRTVDSEARKLHTSFTGVNSASLTLRGNMAGLVNSTQTMVANMRDAHAPASALAAEVGTILKQAVDAGALANQTFYSAINAVAHQAGYTGTSIAQLKGWVDQNATSTQKLSDITDKYGANLTKLPTSKHTTVTNTANTANGQAQNYINTLNNIPRNIFTQVTVSTVHIGGHAYGGITSAAEGGARGGLTMVNENGPELIRLPTGSTVMSNPDTQSAMMRGAFGGGGAQTVELSWGGGGTEIWEFLRRGLRAHIRKHWGGEAQTALGA
jgi:hypothetical protein